MKTPLTTGTVVRKYRVTIDATVQEKSWASPVSTIEHVDPAQHSGYTKTSYNYMKRYCPHQVITLIGGRTSYAHSPTRQIQMATGIPDQAGLKFVSLHECAHILSYTVYADDGFQLAKRTPSTGAGPLPGSSSWPTVWPLPWAATSAAAATARRIATVPAVMPPGRSSPAGSLDRTAGPVLHEGWLPRKCVAHGQLACGVQSSGKVAMAGKYEAYKEAILCTVGRAAALIILQTTPVLTEDGPLEGSPEHAAEKKALLEYWADLGFQRVPGDYLILSDMADAFDP